MALLTVMPLSADATPADAAPAASTGTLGMQCEDFAGRQIRLANRQLRSNDYNAALKVLKTAAENCDIPEVRNKIESVLSSWWNTMNRSGSTRQISTFLATVRQQSYLPGGAESRFVSRVAGSLGTRIDKAFGNGSYATAHELCSSFPSFTNQSFDQQYTCGESARQQNAYASAASRYEWLLENWTTDQNSVGWDDAASRLSDLYMKVARFNDAFGLTKRIAARNSEPQVLMTAVTAVRASMLEPIVRTGSVLMQGMTSDRAVRHVKNGMSRVRFPEYVESVYTVTSDLGADIAFYGADDARLPSSTAVSSASGTVSLLTSESSGRSWLVTPITAGYLFVQFSQKTVAEENVILESLLSNIQDESEWKALYEYEFTSTYPATGSAVATWIAGAQLAGLSVASYQDVFDQTPVLRYYGVQNAGGDIVASHSYARGQINYSDATWSKTSNTPALYHHEVTKNDTALREVVWPMYDDEQWSGVVRVGIISAN
jgi:hypothetical protein